MSRPKWETHKTSENTNKYRACVPISNCSIHVFTENARGLGKSLFLQNLGLLGASCCLVFSITLLT